jgi:hypothetical protein
MNEPESPVAADAECCLMPGVLVEDDHQLDAEREARDPGKYQRPTGTIRERDDGDDRSPSSDDQAGHDLLAAPSTRRAVAMIPDRRGVDQKICTY